MKVEGRCHCGQITYEAIVDPHKVGIFRCGKGIKDPRNPFNPCNPW